MLLSSKRYVASMPKIKGVKDLLQYNNEFRRYEKLLDSIIVAAIFILDAYLYKDDDT